MVIYITSCDSFLSFTSFLYCNFKFTILNCHIFIMILEYWSFDDFIFANFNWISDLATWGIVASRFERSILVGDWGLTRMSRSWVSLSSFLDRVRESRLIQSATPSWREAWGRMTTFRGILLSYNDMDILDRTLHLGGGAWLLTHFVMGWPTGTWWQFSAIILLKIVILWTTLVRAFLCEWISLITSVVLIFTTNAFIAGLWV